MLLLACRLLHDCFCSYIMRHEMLKYLDSLKSLSDQLLMSEEQRHSTFLHSYKLSSFTSCMTSKQHEEKIQLTVSFTDYLWVSVFSYLSCLPITDCKSSVPSPLCAVTLTVFALIFPSSEQNTQDLCKWVHFNWNRLLQSDLTDVDGSLLSPHTKDSTSHLQASVSGRQRLHLYHQITRTFI